MCQFHYSLTNEFSTVTNESSTVTANTSSTVTNKSSTVTNKSSTVTTNVSSTVTNESSTVTNKSSTVTNESSTVMEINFVIQQVMEFVGMGNREQVHSFAAVCKLRRICCLPHLSNIWKVPMDGDAKRRLNVGAFLRYLQMEKFRSVQCIFIPCRKTKGLLVKDMKQVCPSVQTIVHSIWLMVNGRVEKIQKGEGYHQCYRVYWHIMGFTEGKNVWVRCTWDNKYKLVLESLFVMPAFLQQRVRIKTAF
jgi:hypothetical protein